MNIEKALSVLYIRAKQGLSEYSLDGLDEQEFNEAIEAIRRYLIENGSYSLLGVFDE